MKRAFLVILVFFLWTPIVWPCSSHGTNSQAEVNALSACTHLTGDLTIMSTSSSDPIRNLDSLRNTTRIDGNLIIVDNADLTDISGLSRLRYVGGDVLIRDNSQLQQCCHLTELIKYGTVGGSIVMGSNVALSNCNNNGATVHACNPIPTLGEWSLIILSLLMLIIGVYFVKERQAPAPRRYY